jgi:hypothetical protein
MKTRKRWALAAGAAAFAAVGTVGGVAVATNDDGEVGVSGPEADRAGQAALDATGGGTLNAVEGDNETGATWEVEVTKPNGDTVDVRLDTDFHLMVIDGDSEED